MPPLFVLHHPMVMEGLKWHESRGWAGARPPACSGTYHAYELVAIIGGDGGAA